MAASVEKQRATLPQLPSNLSVAFLRDTTVSMKSKQQGFKYFSEGYFEAVSMFHSSENTIQVHGKCFRSQRKSENPHTLHLDITPVDISCAHCSCQAGVCGTCSHVVGLIVALQQWQMMGFTDVPSQLSCTSLPEQWSIPRGQKIDPVAVPHMTFVNPKLDRKKKPITNTLSDCRRIKIQKEDLDQLKTVTDLPISYLVNMPPKTENTHLGCVPVGCGLSTHAKFFEPVGSMPVGTQCGDLVFPKTAFVSLGEQFKVLVHESTREKSIELEEKTRGQAECLLWKTERATRLTASNFGTILKRKKVTDKFISTLLHPKTFTSVQTSYGKNNEKTGLQEYIKQTGNHVHDCGLIVNEKFPFLGGTPDGKVCDKGQSGLIEIKCPYSARDMTANEACGLENFCLEDRNGNLSLKRDHAYYYQVQGQMLTSGIPFCEFVVYTRKSTFIERIFPDVVFMQTMLHDLSNFYFEHVHSAQDASHTCSEKVI